MVKWKPFWRRQQTQAKGKHRMVREHLLLPSAVSPFDSKPVPRKTGTHRFWNLTFAEPEVVTGVTLDVDQHIEHYIVAPGGR